MVSTFEGHLCFSAQWVDAIVFGHCIGTWFNSNVSLRFALAFGGFQAAFPRNNGWVSPYAATMQVEEIN